MADAPLLAIVGAGQMGAAIGATLVAHGVRVITPLSGRSARSVERALSAGMEPCSVHDMRAARAILSIVPPAEAADVAATILQVVGAEGPLFIDANALSPDSKLAMADRVALCGGRFIDGSIIGSPPQENTNGPRFYISGEHASDAHFLKDCGLDVRHLPGSVGTAAALKMCYASLNKGITALATASLLAADRSGVAEALLEEWDISQHFVSARSRRSVPAMYPKAYRWIAEFEEIAAFAGSDRPEGEIFSAIARFFEDRAVAADRGSEELARIKGLLRLR